MLLRRLWQSLLLNILCITAAGAEIIVADDFQLGSYANWTAANDGSDTINLYRGNYSVKLDGLKTLTLNTSTEGFHSVNLSMDLAATKLVRGDACLAEYSTDEGANWQTLGALDVTGSGKEFLTFTVKKGLDNVNQLSVRFRAYTLYDNSCYGDNLELAGTSNTNTVIWQEDFQDNDYSDWLLTGDGSDVANLYSGNYSVRLDGIRQAQYSVSTSNYKDVVLSANVGGLYLQSGDLCFAEYSIDNGNKWRTLVSVGDGQDSGDFHYGLAANDLDQLSSLQFRFRAKSFSGHFCYGDNVRLTGTPIIAKNEPLLAITGATDFGQLPVGDKATLTIELHNTGNAPLNIGQLSDLSDPFGIFADQCSNRVLTVTTKCSFVVVYTPVIEGSAMGEISIPSNAISSPDHLIFTGSSSKDSCEFDCLNGNGNVARQALNYAQLSGDDPVPEVDYSHFALPDEAADPVNHFRGNLTLTISAGSLTEYGTNIASTYDAPDRLPEFSFSFVQYGSHFIPLTRQLVNTGHSSWEWLLLPGRVWNENTDQGFSRVAMPFALQEVNANCTHNGVMTFLFNDDGSVSNVAYQIAQETCAYFKFNLHGKVKARYTPAVVDNEQAVIAAFVEEYANRIEVKPLSMLASDYPAAGINIAQIGSEQTSEHLTSYGLLYKDTLYLGRCTTRTGDYPFCQEMALPSYSTAKTIVTGLGLMRMEQRYGGVQQNLLVSELVNECRAQQWQGVTLLNALDMATGNYDSIGYSVDESAQAMVSGFFLKATHGDKIAHSCSYPRKTQPGSQFVYHSSDSYIVSRGLQNYYQQKAGNQADFYDDLLVADIYKPLHLSPLSYASKRTYDETAQVWGGYGLTLTADDFAKLGRFIAHSNGQLNGQTLLDSNLLADALQQTDNGGLDAGIDGRYQHSLWAYDYSKMPQSGCDSPTWLPYMSGYGGIGVVMLPNQMVYYYVSDNHEYGFAQTVGELQKISPVCN